MFSPDAWARTTGRPSARVSSTVVASGLTMVVVVVSLDPELSPHAATSHVNAPNRAMDVLILLLVT